MGAEPIRRELCDVLERAGLLEQVRRAGDDLEALRRGELRERAAIQREHFRVGAADDQQRRRTHPLGIRSEIGPSTARHDGAHVGP
jgi:hypothetical protein